ncbi:hypothetical protein D3C84_1067790 [compost metagenome]
MSTVKVPPTNFFPFNTTAPSLKFTVPECSPVTFLPTHLIEDDFASIFLVCAFTEILAAATNNAIAIVFKFFMLLN